MARLLKEGKIEDARQLLRSHILVINDSLDTLMLAQNKKSVCWQEL